MARRVGASIVGIFFGLLLGIGVGLFLQLNGTFSMSSKVTLVFPVTGMLLGLLAGAAGGRRGKQA